ncbi:hypothetical protein D3C87_1119830 [compost metagenome]
MRHAAEIVAQQIFTRASTAGENLLVDQAFLVPFGHVGNPGLVVFLRPGMTKLSVINGKVAITLGSGHARIPQIDKADRIDFLTGKVGNFILETVAVRVLVTEGFQNFVDLFRCFRLLQPKLVEPILADEPAARELAIRDVRDEIELAVRSGDGVADFLVAVEECLEVGGVFLDQVIEWNECALQPVANEVFLQPARGVAADDVGKVARGNQKVECIAAAGGRQRRHVADMNVGDLGGLLLHRPFFRVDVFVPEVEVDRKLQRILGNFP